MTQGFYYLAGPYSTPRKPTEAEQQVALESRFAAHLRAKSILIGWGLVIYSPIVSCHALVRAYNLPAGIEFWDRQDKTFIAKAKGLIRLVMDGTFESFGTNSEVNFAKAISIPVYDLVTTKDDQLIWGTIRPEEFGDAP